METKQIEWNERLSRAVLARIGKLQESATLGLAACSNVCHDESLEHSFEGGSIMARCSAPSVGEFCRGVRRLFDDLYATAYEISCIVEGGQDGLDDCEEVLYREEGQ
jgi:hypothetical protein